MASKNLSLVARKLCSAASASKMIKPPIQMFGVEGRYANALYSAATKMKQLDIVEKELVKFQGTAKTDAKLRDFIRDPTIKRKLKSEVIKAVGAKISLSAPSVNLLQLLAENGRLQKLDSVINSFKIIMAAHRGEVTCEVVTAKPLEAAQKQQLEAVLKSFLNSKETLQLTMTVDSKIIGGMIVSIGDRYVDMSVASKVKKYSDLISTPV